MKRGWISLLLITVLCFGLPVFQWHTYAEEEQSIQYSFSEGPVLNDTDEDGRTRFYFNEPCSVRFSVDDMVEPFSSNFSVLCKDYAGNEKNETEILPLSWKQDGNACKAVKTFTEEGNYSVYGYVRSDDSQVVTLKEPILFTIDYSKPVIQNVLFDPCIEEKTNGNRKTRYYDSDFLMQFEILDDVSSVSSYDISLLEEEGDWSFVEVSSVPVQNGNGMEVTVLMEGEFSGIPVISAKNRSGLISTQEAYEKVVLDKTAPTAKLNMEKPSGRKENKTFYNQVVTPRIIINEHHFDEDDAQITLTRNGKPVELLNHFKELEEDIYELLVPLKEEGIYQMEVRYKDASGHLSSPICSGPFVLDFSIQEPLILFSNGEIQVSLEDDNLKSWDVKLFQKTPFGFRDLSEEMICVTDEETKKQFSFSVPDVFSADGIYQVAACVTDEALNESEKTSIFTVNSYGSVFIYDEVMEDILEKNGGHLNEENRLLLNGPIHLVEYYPEHVKKESRTLSMTRDKEMIDAIYEMEITTNEDETDWYKVDYVISPENFELDGTYKILITGENENNTLSQNTSSHVFTKDGEPFDAVLLFTIDRKAPELLSIKELKHRALKKEELSVPFTILDMYGLSEVIVKVDGKEVLHETEISDSSMFEGTFDLKKTGKKQHIQILAVDASGNLFDSDQMTERALQFKRDVYVGANIFQLFLDRKGWVILLLLFALVSLIILMRKKKQDENKKEKK